MVALTVSVPVAALFFYENLKIAIFRYFFTDQLFIHECGQCGHVTGGTLQKRQGHALNDGDAVIWLAKAGHQPGCRFGQKCHGRSVHTADLVLNFTFDKQPDHAFIAGCLLILNFILYCSPRTV